MKYHPPLQGRISTRNLIATSRSCKYANRWQTWKAMYPHTKVVKRAATNVRYYIDPYARYRSEDRVILPSCYRFASL